MKGQEPIRLDKILSNMGWGTRTEIKKIMKRGMVTVNGEVVRDPAQKIIPGKNIIKVTDETVVYREYIYLMMNKPAGVISATEDGQEQTVLDLLAHEYRVFSPFPVGRLDKDTEGLLILTNDGKLGHVLTSPKKKVPKVYYAAIRGEVTEEDTKAFARGVVLDDGYTTLPAKLEILKSGASSEIELTIYEGKYHQVKRMFEARGKSVLYLKRLSMGPLNLDETLETGKYRELTGAEVALLTK